MDAVLLFLLRVKQATRAVLADELAARCDGPKGVDAVLQWMGVHGLVVRDAEGPGSFGVYTLTAEGREKALALQAEQDARRAARVRA